MLRSPHFVSSASVDARRLLCKLQVEPEVRPELALLVFRKEPCLTTKSALRVLCPVAAFAGGAEVTSWHCFQVQCVPATALCPVHSVSFYPHGCSLRSVHQPSPWTDGGTRPRGVVCLARGACSMGRVYLSGPLGCFLLGVPRDCGAGLCGQVVRSQVEPRQCGPHLSGSRSSSQPCGQHPHHSYHWHQSFSVSCHFFFASPLASFCKPSDTCPWDPAGLLSLSVVAVNHLPPPPRHLLEFASRGSTPAPCPACWGCQPLQGSGEGGGTPGPAAPTSHPGRAALRLASRGISFE